MGNEMFIPQQLRNQQAEADRLIAEIRGQGQPPAAPQPPAEPPAQPPAPEAGTELPANTPPGAPGVADPLPIEPLPPAAPADMGAEFARLQHSLSVLQGKYNAEVPRLLAENRELLAQLQARNQETERLKQVVTTAVDQGRELTAEQLKAMLGEATVEEFGEGYLKTQARIAGTFADQRLKAELEPVKQDLDRMRSEMFTSRLSLLVPNWERMNEAPEFVAWLQEVDPLSQMRRHDLLLQAYQRRDANNVARFFTAFLTQGTGAPAPARAPAAPARPAPTVSPARGPAPAGTPPKPTYTEAQLLKMRDDVLKGRIGDPAERNRIIKEVESAFAEGRVTG